MQQMQGFCGCDAWSLGSPWQLGGEPPKVIFFKPFRCRKKGEVAFQGIGQKLVRDWRAEKWMRDKRY